jgi:hypothetical protein
MGRSKGYDDISAETGKGQQEWIAEGLRESPFCGVTQALRIASFA